MTVHVSSVGSRSSGVLLNGLVLILMDLVKKLSSWLFYVFLSAGNVLGENNLIYIYRRFMALLSATNRFPDFLLPPSGK